MFPEPAVSVKSELPFIVLVKFSVPDPPLFDRAALPVSETALVKEIPADVVTRLP